MQRSDQTDEMQPTFDFGIARRQHEEIFHPILADEIAGLLFTLPAGVRYHAKQRVFEGVRRHYSVSGRIDAAALHHLWHNTLIDLGIPPASATLPTEPKRQERIHVG